MAHAGKKAVKDILAASMKPVMLSHTSSKKVYDNGRNLSDEEIKEIADHGGLVGCMTSPAALAPLHERREHTLDRFILHLTGMINAGGIDHAGLGLHFCEYLYTPDRYPPVRDLENASKAGGIIGKLEEAGFSPEAVEKIAWKNFFRLFKDVTGSPPAGPEGRSAVY
jgi:membrane dipeptidase